MVKVTIGDTVLAESNKTVVVEGNHYFTPEDVKTTLFSGSDTRYVLSFCGLCLVSDVAFDCSTVCPWKG